MGHVTTIAHVLAGLTTEYVFCHGFVVAGVYVLLYGGVVVHNIER